MSFLKKLHFEKSKVQFADSRKLLEATLKGKFDRDDVKTQINQLAKSFNSPKVQLGVALHYKNVNKWTPSLITPSNQNIPVWDSSDSPDTAEAYRNDTVDAIHVFVIEDNANVGVNKFRKPKKY